MTIDPAIVARLEAALGPKGFSEDANEIAPHLTEWRGRYRGHTPILLKPSSTSKVSEILRICTEGRVPVVPQGGNTGLVGGQIPLGGEILLSLERLNCIREIDRVAMTATVEAGVPLQTLQIAASDAGAYFPLSLASEGTCTIGGNLSTNAGGLNVLRYGSARNLVLGIKVVLADGRVLDLLRSLHKDNTGYDLKQLFIGAEGTLGVITAAVLKLFPKPVVRETAFVAVRDPQSAIDLLNRLQHTTGGLISTFELIPRIGIEFVAAHIPQTTDPMARASDWYVLLEAGSAAVLPLRDAVEGALATAMADGLVSDAVIASSEAQRQALWRLRDGISEAQKFEGGSIKHDVSVPVRAIPEFLRRGVEAVSALVPRIRPVPFGHLGDGNIHFNLSVPKGGDSDAFLARWDEISHVVHELVHEFGGSISAEHGLGIMKRDEIRHYKGAAELDVMRALKRTLDPNNILNPGKVISL